MLRRPYGSSNEHLSIVGFGGIVVDGLEQAEANRIVREAFDRGVNYFDVAPSYGHAEDRLGPALVGIRDEVFLACKTEKRGREDAAGALRASLGKLRTDRFDLYQLHGLASLEEAERCFAPGGAMEALTAARDDGLVRYLGFSAHSTAAALYCLAQNCFDSVLFPFNHTAFYQRGFGPQVIEAAESAGVARLALKALARRPWPDGAERTHPKCWYEPYTDRAEAESALRWTLSLPITAAIPPGDPDVFALAVDIAEHFAPMSDSEIEQMRIRSNAHDALFDVD